MGKVMFFSCFVAAMLVLPSLALAQSPLPPTEELEAARARAERYREMAGDFEGAAYFPSDWEAAEALRARAAGMPMAADYTDGAIAAYNAAADSFAAIFRLSVSLYAQAREDEIMIVREGLVAAGARVSFPELMGPADRAALTALHLYESEDYYPARDYAAQAYAMFRILETALGAWQMRQEIVQRGFIDYARDNFELAEEIIAAAMQGYLERDFFPAQENALEAQARYSLVLSAGWAAAAEYNFYVATVERRAAMEARANVAARELFEQADAMNSAAADLLRMEYYREAAEKFADAEAMYFAARVSAMERRRIASEAIMEANRQIEEAIRTAQGAGLNSN